MPLTVSLLLTIENKNKLFLFLRYLFVMANCPLFRVRLVIDSKHKPWLVGIRCGTLRLQRCEVVVPRKWETETRRRTVNFRIRLLLIRHCTTLRSPTHRWRNRVKDSPVSPEPSQGLVKDYPWPRTVMSTVTTTIDERGIEKFRNSSLS